MDWAIFWACLATAAAVFSAGIAAGVFLARVR